MKRLKTKSAAKPKATKPRGLGSERFYVRVQFAGREGVQDEVHASKRQAIRMVRNLVKQGSFGTTGAVWTVRGKPDGSEVRQLLYQCSMRMNRKGKTILHIDEL